ncbi:hypothetical protein [Bradyrhizobium guangxiense]|uniref:hypothetical protein n=1 Tax=Bradyrhizobium guangxiense TaxID=1325115 RepID=UPI0010087EFF|nr:hypothetical protein [Bradyrhizobium guangxiense]
MADIYLDKERYGRLVATLVDIQQSPAMTAIAEDAVKAALGKIGGIWPEDTQTIETSPSKNEPPPLKKPKWQRILELEAAAKGALPELTAGAYRPEDPPVARQMADDLREIRRKQSIEFYAPGIALLLVVGFIVWFLRH